MTISSNYFFAANRPNTHSFTFFYSSLFGVVLSYNPKLLAIYSTFISSTSANRIFLICCSKALAWLPGVGDDFCSRFFISKGYVMLVMAALMPLFSDVSVGAYTGSEFVSYMSLINERWSGPFRALNDSFFCRLFVLVFVCDTFVPNYWPCILS